VNLKFRFRRTTIISASLLAFLVGLVLAKSGWRVDVVVALIPAGLLVVFRKRTVATVLVVLVLGLLLGVWRGGAVQQQVAEYGQFYGRTVLVSGRVLDDPVYDKAQLDFRLGAVLVDGHSLPGQVRVKTLANGIRRGDDLRVRGKLRDGFGNYQASMYFADVAVTAHSNSPLEKLRREFFAAVYSVLPEPQASLGLGFLVGLRSSLPEDLDEQLRIVGLTHIVVASGYNLTVLVRLSRRILAKHSKYQAFAGSIALMLVFLAVTGASPSMVRASVVTALSLLAWYYGRRFQPVLIILLGAALTAGVNPLFIWHDLGWWLSFLAFAGVLVLAPLISARFLRDKSPPLLAQVAIETLAAQLLTMPLILFMFGQLSVVALVANVAVVPLIPYAMASTALAGLAGMALPGGFAGWLAVPAQLLLSYVVSAIRLFALPSWAQREVGIDVVGLVLLYALILGGTTVLYAKSKVTFSKIPSVVE